jgi:DnaJ-class molecular chaperone
VTLGNLIIVPPPDNLTHTTQLQQRPRLDLIFVPVCVSREEVNKAYRKLAVLLHPDKCVAPGSEDAFKAVVNARTSLLKNIK